MNRPSSTWLLMLGVTAWILGAMVAALAGAILMAFVAGFIPVTLDRWGLPGSAIFPNPNPLAYALCGMVGFQLTLLAAGLRHGRGALHNPAPLRPRLILGLAAILGCWAISVSVLSAAVPALRDLISGSTSEVLREGSAAGLAILIPGIVLVAILAPVAEEMFFRGWLWDALQRRGHGALATSCITAGLWLALHALETPARVLFLIPAGIVLSYARHRAGGVRASIAVHIANNSLAAAMMALAALTAAG